MIGTAAQDKGKRDKEMTQQLTDFRYMFAVILAFAITALLGPLMIPVLRRLKVGNTEREELKSHQKKMGTPTMGGLMILLAIIITSLFFISSYPKIIPVLFVTEIGRAHV